MLILGVKIRGLHGYSHENPLNMNLEQQRAILDKTYKQLTDFCGKPPRGSVAPWWESTKEGGMELLKRGVEYGNAFFHISCPFPLIHVLRFLMFPKKDLNQIQY